MSRIKVVHLHKMTGISGSEKHLLQMLPVLDRAMFEPVLLILTGRGGADAGFVAALRENGVRVEEMPIRGHIDPLLLIRLMRWFTRERPGIVHTHLIHADVHGVPAARLANVPLVFSTKHNDDRFRRHPLIIALERWLARRVDRTITISESLRRFVLESTPQDPECVVTIRYGYDASADAPPAIDLPRDSPVPAGVPCVLAVGRLVGQKGHDVLITAFDLVRKRVPEARLVIVGAGARRSQLERLICQNDLQNHVTLAGHRRDVGAFMHQATVFAHPSRWEGFGLVLLEAMAAGRPVVASGVSAIPEIVQHGTTGLLVPADDAVALAEALTCLLQDRELADRLGLAGRHRLEREFSRDRMTRATEALYRAAMDAAARRTNRRTRATR